MERKKLFEINLAEYILIIKLVECRVMNEIHMLQAFYESNKNKKITKVHLLELPHYAKFALSKDGIQSVVKEICDKKRWITEWVAGEYKKLSKLEPDRTLRLKKRKLADLIDEQKESDDTAIRFFLILQEAIMVPLYWEKEQSIYEERFTRNNLEHVSRMLGLDFSSGKDTLSKFNKHLEYITGNWRSTVKAAVIGIAVILPFSVIILPAALKALTSLIGLNSADITAEGVANLGTGALAVKDNENDKVRIQIAGGLLFGASVRDELFSWFDLLSKETVAILCSKTLNLIQFLHETRQDEALSEVPQQFLQSKYELEKSLLHQQLSEDRMKSMLGKTELLYRVFKRINLLNIL